MQTKTSEPLKLTHIAKAALKCYMCAAAIPPGAKFRRYRERAVSNHEACHAGTMYPHRNQCVGCVDKINASRVAA